MWGSQSPEKTRGDNSNSAIVTNSQPHAPIQIAPVSNLLLSKMQHNEATVDGVVSQLGSHNTSERRQAAEAIFALQSHYSDACKQFIERGYAQKLDAMSQWHAMITLSVLRPHDAVTIDGAVKHISFSWTPSMINFSIMAQAYSATFIVVRASLPALPALANAIANSAPSSKSGPLQEDMNADCVQAILGPAASSWLLSQAQTSNDPIRQRNFRQAVTYISKEWALPQSSGKPSPWFLAFGAAGALRGTYDDADLEEADTPPIKIDWNAPEQLDAKLPFGTHSYAAIPATEKAVGKICLTMKLLEYGITQRLSPDNPRRTKFAAYPKEAQTDAIRVLGCLRSDVPWIIWQHLRENSLKHAIDTDSSDDTQACLRALGQIDVPSADLLTDCIATELAPQQQEAAAFALGKVMGKYAVFFIQGEIAARQRFAVLASKEKDQSEHELYLSQIQRLETMLKVGTEKQWFTGEFYGSNDPHAYDLTFGNESEAVKIP